MSARNLSALTVDGYERNLTSFIECATSAASRGPDEITKPVIDRYQKWLYQNRRDEAGPLTFRTQYQKLGAAKYFFAG